MDDGFYLALELGPQGNNIPPVPLGDDAVLQFGGSRCIGQVALHPGHQAVVRHPHLSAQVV